MHVLYVCYINAFRNHLGDFLGWDGFVSADRRKTGPQYAFYYKWANILSRTQFQKYSKRGYDVKVGPCMQG